MNVLLKYTAGIAFFLLLTGCHSSKLPPIPYVPESEAFFPSQEIALPQTDIAFLYPRDTLAVQKPYLKDITKHFTRYDANELKVKDPKLFAGTDTEIIDFSLIPEGEYAFPLPGGKVISPYAGRRTHHSGVDLKTCANDTIVAAFDGIVRLSKPYASYGNLVIIRHYNGLETLYSHNSKNLVKPGDEVKAGQPIALTGRTGRATTEHLHFEARINGHHFNPSLLFDMEKGEIHRKCLVFTANRQSISVNSVDLFPHQLAGPYEQFAETATSGTSSPGEKLQN